MVSKNQIKFITSLHQKKFREINGLFIAEGVKVVQELLQSNIALEHLYQTSEIFKNFSSEKMSIISEDELKKISALTNQTSCLAIFRIPEGKKISQNDLIVALDGIRDPGNMGTIIRLCDWYGITQIVCSHDTVEIYNPKVVQATMGSIARVYVNYVDLRVFLSETNEPVYGTFMDGKAIYTERLNAKGIIVFGNEANGISPEIESLISNKIAIPRFGTIQKTESLNVSSAVAICLSEFKRIEFSGK
jgi:RNA methyltransferase, TrmH family